MVHRVTAVGPSRAGCHDLPELDVAEFHALGGVDIQVWDRDWIVAGSLEAIEHVAQLFALQELSPTLAELRSLP